MSHQEQARIQLLHQLRHLGITDERVLQAIEQVPRHCFVPEPHCLLAYDNQPLPIGSGQTISQPYIVALMTQLANLSPEHRVLEVGTGSGYQTAVLARLVSEVYTIEIIEDLAERASHDLRQLQLAGNIHFRVGDGYQGWPDAAPFDAIIVTAAPPEIPEPLKSQLRIGGRLVIPVGDTVQELRTLLKYEHGFEEQQRVPVRFVPMTGEAQNYHSLAVDGPKYVVP